MVNSVLTRPRRVIQLFRNMDPTIPSQCIALFLAIAEIGEVDSRDAADLVGISNQAANRFLSFLSDKNTTSDRKPPLRLIEYRVHPDDRRLRVATLSTRGRQLVAQIEEIMDG